MSKSTKLPNSSKLPQTMADVISKVPQGKALALIAQYGPQVFNQVLQEDQKIVKLDNIAQSLKLNTPELYSFNAAVENAGGDWNEVTNLYQTVQKLNNNDPKNKKKLDTIKQYTGIENSIDEHGSVTPDFLKQLSNSIVLPDLKAKDRTELYEILGIKHGDGIERLLSQGPGKLMDAANRFSPLAPSEAQINNSHQNVSEALKAKYIALNQAHVAEESDPIHTLKSATNSVEDFLIQNAPAINHVERVNSQNHSLEFFRNLMDPKARQEASDFAMQYSDEPRKILPEILHYLYNPVDFRAQKARQDAEQEQVTPVENQTAPLQNFAKEVDHARKSALTDRYHQNHYFTTLAKNQKQGIGTRPISLSFGNINVETREDDDPFAFAEAVKGVVSDELMKLIVSFGPYR